MWRSLCSKRGAHKGNLIRVLNVALCNSPRPCILVFGILSHYVSYKMLSYIMFCTPGWKRKRSHALTRRASIMNLRSGRKKQGTWAPRDIAFLSPPHARCRLARPLLTPYPPLSLPQYIRPLPPTHPIHLPAHSQLTRLLLWLRALRPRNSIYSHVPALKHEHVKHELAPTARATGSPPR